jgi:hypothetical protein
VKHAFGHLVDGAVAAGGDDQVGPGLNGVVGDDTGGARTRRGRDRDLVALSGEGVGGAIGRCAA